jgi:hypothetical protein
MGHPEFLKNLERPRFRAVYMKNRNTMKYTFMICIICILLLACSDRPPSDAAAAPPARDSQVVLTSAPVRDTLPPATAPDEEALPDPAPQKDQVAPLPKKSKPTTAAPPAPTATDAAPGPAPAPRPILRATDPDPDRNRPTHDAWNLLLSKHVGADGRVDYKGFRAARAALDGYLKELAAAPPQQVWTRAEKMAYWINAYNAFTVDLIVDHYPVSSITKLDNGKPWDVRRIVMGGKKYSLNDIENEILRPQFKDARIHFVLNCAAKSCPPLYNRAITARNLERVLEQRTREFINNPAFMKLTPDKSEISRIFEWYAADFGEVRSFLKKYNPAVSLTAPVQYLEYDWSLNE